MVDEQRFDEEPFDEEKGRKISNKAIAVIALIFLCIFLPSLYYFMFYSNFRIVDKKQFSINVTNQDGLPLDASRLMYEMWLYHDDETDRETEIYYGTVQANRTGCLSDINESIFINVDINVIVKVFSLPGDYYDNWEFLENDENNITMFEKLTDVSVQIRENVTEKIQQGNNFSIHIDIGGKKLEKDFMDYYYDYVFDGPHLMLTFNTTENPITIIQVICLNMSSIKLRVDLKVISLCFGSINGKIDVSVNWTSYGNGCQYEITKITFNYRNEILANIL